MLNCRRLWSARQTSWTWTELRVLRTALVMTWSRIWPALCAGCVTNCCSSSADRMPSNHAVFGCSFLSRCRLKSPTIFICRYHCHNIFGWTWSQPCCRHGGLGVGTDMGGYWPVILVPHGTQRPRFRGGPLVSVEGTGWSLWCCWVRSIILPVRDPGRTLDLLNWGHQAVVKQAVGISSGTSGLIYGLFLITVEQCWNSPFSLSIVSQLWLNGPYLTKLNSLRIKLNLKWSWRHTFVFFINVLELTLESGSYVCGCLAPQYSNITCLRLLLL